MQLCKKCQMRFNEKCTEKDRILCAIDVCRAELLNGGDYKNSTIIRSYSDEEERVIEATLKTMAQRITRWYE